MKLTKKTKRLVVERAIKKLRYENFTCIALREACIGILSDARGEKLADSYTKMFNYSPSAFWVRSQLDSTEDLELYYNYEKRMRLRILLLTMFLEAS